jgi:hypothetical protein
MLAALGISTAFAFIKGKAVQFFTGAAGYTIAVVLVLIIVAAGATLWRSDYANALIAKRDLSWFKTVTAATDKARAEQKALDDAVRKAGDDKRAELELQLEAQRERTAEREREIARMKSDPICIPADMER